MAIIKRGVGVSPTEKNLAALADKIFLNLWTYPNLYGSAGKERCDLLVRGLLQLPPSWRATAEFASRIARPSLPVFSRRSLATFAQSSLSSVVVALWVCFSASFGVHGIWLGS